MILRKFFAKRYLIMLGALAALLSLAYTLTNGLESKASTATHDVSPNAAPSYDPAVGPCLALIAEMRNDEPRIDGLAATFQSNVADIVSWEEVQKRVPTSAFRSFSGDKPISVCYLDGEFSGIPCPPGLPGATKPACEYTRIMVLVPGSDGTHPEIKIAGPKEKVEIVAPPGAR